MRIPRQGEARLLVAQRPDQHVRPYPLQHEPRHGRNPRGRHQVPIGSAAKFNSFSQRRRIRSFVFSPFETLRVIKKIVGDVTH